MTRGQIRFLSLVFVFLAIWRLMEVPAISEAFWYFVTVGVVPGTDIVLAADTVIRILLGVFVLTVALIFRKELINSLPESWTVRQPEVELSSQDRPQSRSRSWFQSPAPVHKPSVITIVPGHQIVRQKWAKAPRIIAIILGYSLYGASVIGATLDRVLRFVAQYIRQFAGAAFRVAKIVGHRLYIVVVKLWYFIEPSLREFDHWINITVHKSKLASETLDILEVCIKEVQIRWRAADSRTRRLFQDK
ncbi:MAG TPA: hypothetical protein VF733_05770 [Candidatus Saccharimonadales bacterium]